MDRIVDNDESVFVLSILAEVEDEEDLVGDEDKTSPSFLPKPCSLCPSFMGIISSFLDNDNGPSLKLKKKEKDLFIRNGNKKIKRSDIIYHIFFLSVIYIYMITSDSENECYFVESF